KQFRVGPDVTRVWRHKERQISDQAQTLAMGMCLEPITLTEQQELREAHLADLVRQFASNAVQGLRLALDQFCRPVEIIGTLEFAFWRPEEGVVPQPMHLIMAELIIG